MHSFVRAGFVGLLTFSTAACASPVPPPTEYPADYYRSLLAGHVFVNTYPENS